MPEPGLGAFNVDVIYNTMYVRQDSCVSNIAFCGSFPQEGRTRLAGAIAQGQSGRVVLANLTFEAIAFRPGTANINFVVNQLATPMSEELEATTQHAEILVNDTPGPTSIPARQGDTDCDGDADTVDALGVLRDTAGLPDPSCIARGDVDCDGDRDSVDALAILRYTAGLPPGPQDEPCPDIGVVG